MNKSANEYTMQDQSSKPYAWTIEGVDAADVRSMGVEEWVKSYVMNIIPVSAELQGIDPDVTVEEIYAALEENGEIDAMVAYVDEWAIDQGLLFDDADYIETEFPTIEIEHDGESVEFGGVKIRCYNWSLWIDGGEYDDFHLRTIVNANLSKVNWGEKRFTEEIFPADQKKINLWLANQE